ncbi:unnamed protein product [Caenorhabditis brenneri]
MSMLRRPLTQLELCEDDIQWLSDQLAKQDAPLINEIKCEAMDVDEEEPMDQSGPTQGISRKSLRSSGRKKNTPGSSSGDCARTTAMASARTPVDTPSWSLSTPVNAISSSEIMPIQPAARLVRPARRPRASRVAEIEPPLFNAFDTPQQPAGGVNGSPTPSDSPESPNAHLYATPSNPAANSGGPSSNTRSQRH